MKRSKILLGITTGVLAVVSLTAAKVKFTNRFITGYYKGATSLGCTLKSSAKAYTVQIASANVAYTTRGAANFKYDLYTQFSSTSCPGHPLYTKAGE